MIRALSGKTPRIAASAWVSEAAYVVGDVELGENCTVWPGTVIRGDLNSIRIGNNVHVEDGSILHAAQTPLVIGDTVVIGHGVVIHCQRIDDNVLIGSNATVLEYVEVGSFSMIAAGSLVSPRMKIPPGSFVAGHPAEVRGEIRDNQRQRIVGASRAQWSMAQLFREAGLEARREG